MENISTVKISNSDQIDQPSIPFSAEDRHLRAWNKAYQQSSERSEKDSVSSNKVDDAAMTENESHLSEEEAIKKKWQTLNSEDKSIGESSKKKDEKQNGTGLNGFTKDKKEHALEISSDALQSLQPLPNANFTVDMQFNLSNANTGNAINEQAVVELIQELCSNLYVSPTAGNVNLSKVVLEIGNVLPGTFIEMNKANGGLSILIRSTDERSLRTLRQARSQLTAILSESTDLSVNVDIQSDSYGEGA